MSKPSIVESDQSDDEADHTWISPEADHSPVEDEDEDVNKDDTDTAGNHGCADANSG